MSLNKILFRMVPARGKPRSMFRLSSSSDNEADSPSSQQGGSPLVVRFSRTSPNTYTCYTGQNNRSARDQSTQTQSAANREAAIQCEEMSHPERDGGEGAEQPDGPGEGDDQINFDASNMLLTDSIEIQTDATIAANNINNNHQNIITIESIRPADVVVGSIQLQDIPHAASGFDPTANAPAAAPPTAAQPGETIAPAVTINNILQARTTPIILKHAYLKQMLNPTPFFLRKAKSSIKCSNFSGIKDEYFYLQTSSYDLYLNCTKDFFFLNDELITLTPDSYGPVVDSPVPLYHLFPKASVRHLTPENASELVSCMSKLPLNLETLITDENTDALIKSLPLDEIFLPNIQNAKLKKIPKNLFHFPFTNTSASVLLDSFKISAQDDLFLSLRHFFPLMRTQIVIRPKKIIMYYQDVKAYAHYLQQSLSL